MRCFCSAKFRTCTYEYVRHIRIHVHVSIVKVLNVQRVLHFSAFILLLYKHLGINILCVLNDKNIFASLICAHDWF